MLDFCTSVPAPNPFPQLIRLAACFADSQLAVFCVWVPCWRFGDIAETFALEDLATDPVVVPVHQQVYLRRLNVFEVLTVELVAARSGHYFASWTKLAAVVTSYCFFCFLHGSLFSSPPACHLIDSSQSVSFGGRCQAAVGQVFVTPRGNFFMFLTTQLHYEGCWWRCVRHTVPTDSRMFKGRTLAVVIGCL